MLIVIVTIAIIAAIVIPRVESAIDDANRSAAYANLHELTTAVERYKMHHGARAPDNLAGESLPQLSSGTDMLGNIGTGAAYPFGPYLLGEIPVNSITGLSKVVRAPSVPPTNFVVNAGWIYDPVTGQIWAAETTNRTLP